MGDILGFFDKASKLKHKLKDKPKDELKSKSELEKEYYHLCAQAGDKQYAIDVMKAELRGMNQKLFEMHQKLKLVSEQEEQKKAAEVTPIKEGEKKDDSTVL